MRIEIVAQSNMSDGEPNIPEWAGTTEDGITRVIVRMIINPAGGVSYFDGWVLLRINGGLVLLRGGKADPSNPDSLGVWFEEPTREFLETEISVSIAGFRELTEQDDAEKDHFDLMRADYFERQLAGLRAAIDEMTAAG